VAALTGKFDPFRRALHRVNDGCCSSVAPTDSPVQHSLGLPGVAVLDKPARLFLCARCCKQVLICNDCDRGNRYCASGCANVVRRALQRDAGDRYQDSYVGRIKHAWRTRRWRQRNAQAEQSVTHQGSQLGLLDAVLAATPTPVPAPAVAAPPPPCASILKVALATGAASAACALPASTWRCHWCGERCTLFVRLGFLRHSPNHGHSP